MGLDHARGRSGGSVRIRCGDPRLSGYGATQPSVRRHRLRARRLHLRHGDHECRGHELAEEKRVRG